MVYKLFIVIVCIVLLMHPACSIQPLSCVLRLFKIGFVYILRSIVFVSQLLGDYAMQCYASFVPCCLTARQAQKHHRDNKDRRLYSTMAGRSLWWLALVA